MNKLLEKINPKNLKNVQPQTWAKIGLFLIPFFGVILKCIFVQCFIQSDSPYNFSFTAGYTDSASYYIKYYIAYTLIFFSFALLFKGKGRIIYLFVIDAILTTLCILDVMYFRGFLTMPSVLVFTQTANLDNLGNTLTSMLSPYDILFLLDFIILGVYVYFTKSYYKEKPKRAVKTFALSLVISLLYVGYIPFNLYILNNEDVDGAYMFDGYDPTNTSEYFSSIGYHIIDAYTVYRDSKPYTLTSEEEEQVKTYYDWKNENLADNEFKGISKGKNLIVIQVESLESFIIGKEYNGQKITPNMDKLIEKGLYFPNIYEQVNEGTSSDCDFMTNTSLLPLRRGGTFFRYPNADYNSMPKILASDGYETASIHPDKGSFWNYSNALSGGIGFEHFFDYYSFQETEKIGMGISDEAYFTQVIPKIKNFKEPFFVHTITLTNHGPFDLPTEKRTFNLNEELGKSEMGGYIESVHYTDAQIGKFINNLEKEGLLDNSLIVITGDHAGVHKYYNDSTNKLSTKEDWFVDDGEHKVPLIIYDTGIKESKTLEVIGGQIDTMPTILYLLGIDNDKYINTAMGRNLLNTNRSYAIINDGTVKGDNLSEKDIEIIKSSQELSDKIIRADYFKR